MEIPEQIGNLFTREGFLAAITVVLIYILLWFLVRWHFIASPGRYLLQAQIDSVRARIYTEQQKPEFQSDYEIAIIKEIEEILKKGEVLAEKEGLKNWLFWNRGQEIAAWCHIHEAERQMVALFPVERVRARLETAAEELRSGGQPEAVVLADKIKKTLEPPGSPNAQAESLEKLVTEKLDQQLTARGLDPTPPQTPSPAAGQVPPPAPPPQRPPAEPIQVAPSLNELRALLQEALRIVYGARDTDFAGLVTLHNKSTWLLGVALLLVLTLAAVDNPILLLLGALGGFFSRLTRILRSEAVPTDYGAYWTTLFLSPLFGALAGWVGILLISSLANAQILGQTFEGVQWDKVEGTTARTASSTTGGTRQNPALRAPNGQPDESPGDRESTPVPSPRSAWALAFLLGFSERFFNGIVSILERRSQEATPASGTAPPQRI